MRISDWCSDVCSSDLRDRAILRLLQVNARQTHAEIGEQVGLSPSACHRRIRLLEEGGHIAAYTIVLGRSDGADGRVTLVVQVTLERQTEDYLSRFEQIGRASCRERVFTYVKIVVVAVPFKKKKKTKD